MTVRGTLALVVVAVVLGAWALLERLHPPGPPVVPTLLGAPPASASRIEVSEPDATLVAIRRDGGWVDAAGRAWPPRVDDDFLDALSHITALRDVDAAPAGTNDYGFAGRRLRVLGADGATLLDVELGDRNPALTGVYVRRADRPEVLLVGALVVWELKKLHDAAPSW